MQDRVDFMRVGIEGFGSIQAPINFPLDAKGINMICGTNGAGKTTVFSALYWCLYGGVLKEVTSTDIPTRASRRTQDFRGTRVIVDFAKEGKHYRLARHLKFTGTTKGLRGGDSLMLFEKETDDWDFEADDLQGEAKYKEDIAKKVEEIIGVSAKGFLNAILFGQRMKRLVETDGKDKRALFEELFEMAFIERAKEKAKDKKNELDAVLGRLDTDIVNEEASIEDLKGSIDTKEKLLEEWAGKKKKDVESTLETYKEEQESLKALQTSRTELTKKASKYEEKKEEELKSERDKAEKVSETNEEAEKLATRQVVSCDREIEKSTGKIAKLQEDLGEVKTHCPYCKTALKKSDVEAVIKGIKTSIETEQKVLKELEKNRKEHQEVLLKAEKSNQIAYELYQKALKVYQEYRDNSKEYRDAKTELSIVDTKIESQTKICETAKIAWEKAKSAEEPKYDLSGDKEKLTTRQESLEKMLEEEDKKKNELSRVVWWIDKGFGARGLKAYIFNAMLNRLNLYIEKYAELLGVQVKFSVDMSKASKPFTTTCYFEGEQVAYETLSGGEKQRVDVAMAFAMHDLVSHNANVNILIMDEVFEGLDTDGVEAVYELVRLKAEEGKCVYIITHALEIDSSFTKRIEVSYDAEKRTTVVR